MPQTTNTEIAQFETAKTKTAESFGTGAPSESAQSWAVESHRFAGDCRFSLPEIESQIGLLELEGKVDEIHHRYLTWAPPVDRVAQRVESLSLQKAPQIQPLEFPFL